MDFTEQQLAERFEQALADGEITAYLQPQYNHTTGYMMGAEALARWVSPQYGFISPAQFIPALEENNLISVLDKHIFTQVCALQRKCIDDGLAAVPVSCNLTRYDLFQEGFLEELEAIRASFAVPVRLLRIEITESTAIGGAEAVNAAIGLLHEYGYLVEMDDFGSGYSSLNSLKDMDIDIIKLDMKFMEDSTQKDSKGSLILISVIRLAKWLKLPIIAEGVETQEQADFLRSLGCDCIQGYFYSRPVQGEQFIGTLAGGGRSVLTGRQGDRTVDSPDFWNPGTLDALLFSSMVGGAAVLSYDGQECELVQVNRKYLQEIGMNEQETELVGTDPLSTMDESNKETYIQAIKKAIAGGEEEECETRRTICTTICGDDDVYIRSTMKLLGKRGQEYLFYVMIRNITVEKRQQAALLGYENSFKRVTEQVNIYYWEYTVATKEMRPCFRCMRDLGLPPVVRNYPEPAFEAGIFPMDYAEMYRDWHRQIASGVKELEAIIPLTVGRVPFRVKYTTEFDENGNPVKAYGSATYVPESERE